jgi:hypothetical protein
MFTAKLKLHTNHSLASHAEVLQVGRKNFFVNLHIENLATRSDFVILSKSNNLGKVVFSETVLSKIYHYPPPGPPPPPPPPQPPEMLGDERTD